MLGEEFMAAVKKTSLDPYVCYPSMMRNINDNMRCDTWEKRTKRKTER